MHTNIGKVRKREAVDYHSRPLILVPAFFLKCRSTADQANHWCWVFSNFQLFRAPAFLHPTGMKTALTKRQEIEPTRAVALYYSLSANDVLS